MKPQPADWRAAFTDLLLRWNARINLISGQDVVRVAERHIADSLQLRAFIPAGTDRAIDIGSGGGFPGLVLAKETGIAFDLVEADQRKAAFLRAAARLIEAPVSIHAARAEVVGLSPAPLLTARAVAPLRRLLALAYPLLAADGVCLFPKGESYNSELTEAAAEWHMKVERFPSRTAPHAAILRISELHRVADRQ